MKLIQSPPVTAHIFMFVTVVVAVITNLLSYCYTCFDSCVNAMDDQKAYTKLDHIISFLQDNNIEFLQPPPFKMTV